MIRKPVFNNPTPIASNKTTLKGQKSLAKPLAAWTTRELRKDNRWHHVRPNDTIDGAVVKSITLRDGWAIVVFEDGSKYQTGY